MRRRAGSLPSASGLADIEALHREQCADARKTSLDLIGNQHDPMLVA
jgi:hypothetical protein